ncbi:DUF4235 domain-containing protein [Pseudonocardia sp. RS010]|uniref:DUF4235 domain-containing protein n=1 Tax=Pseudonocardia sp. RS010 TaxID=3385979 RepID=UPI0039A2AD36
MSSAAAVERVAVAAPGYVAGMSGKKKAKPAELGDDLPAPLKLAYRPVGILSGLLGGLIASQVFNQVWKRVSDEPETPQPLSRDYGTKEVLIAATVQGAIFGLIKTAVDRYGMKAFHRFVDKPRPASH